MAVYKVCAEVISDVYVTIEADSEEEALEYAHDHLDGGDFVPDVDSSGYESGDFNIGSYAAEIDPGDHYYGDGPMFNAKDI